MPKPMHCAPEVYDIVRLCWEKLPMDRLSFSTLHERLDTLSHSKVVGTSVHTALHHMALHNTELHHTALHHAALHHTKLHHAALHHTSVTSYSITSYRITSSALHHSLHRAFLTFSCTMTRHTRSLKIQTKTSQPLPLSCDITHITKLTSSFYKPFLSFNYLYLLVCVCK